MCKWPKHWHSSNNVQHFYLLYFSFSIQISNSASKSFSCISTENVNLCFFLHKFFIFFCLAIMILSDSLILLLYFNSSTLMFIPNSQYWLIYFKYCVIVKKFQSGTEHLRAGSSNGRFPYPVPSSSKIVEFIMNRLFIANESFLLDFLYYFVKIKRCHMHATFSNDLQISKDIWRTGFFLTLHRWPYPKKRKNW